ncbi:MAG: indole-3-glycerol phosphate synthase TrpC [Nitrospira sp.]|nr:indole-3-glycerol phosphate synthase TrpC [Candidatus Manganitrophaceae bacterium]HIL35408.1 indole-3-glycerol phosphate synthase TrpC [Candidatus Manganitrophaceae bacterium]
MRFLDEIVKVKREEVAGRLSRAALRELRSRIGDAEPTRPFQKALSAKDHGWPSLIAEIKKASPSKGIIRERFDPLEIAQIYEDGGAAALSILTEEHFFLGNPATLKAVRSKVSLPLLKKDFIIDAIQVYEGRAWGADAILLIAALLEKSEVKDYFDLARELTLDVLVEVHTEKELEMIVEWAPMIGINNRNLETFETNLETTFRLLKEVPEGRTLVSESGIASRKDIEALQEAGIDAILVGESLMASEDIGKKMKELIGE